MINYNPEQLMETPALVNVQQQTEVWAYLHSYYGDYCQYIFMIVLTLLISTFLHSVEAV